MTLGAVTSAPADTDVDLLDLGQLLAAKAPDRERISAALHDPEGPCGQPAEYAIALWCPTCGVRSACICSGRCLQVVDTVVYAGEDIPIRCAHHNELATVLGKLSPLRY